MYTITCLEVTSFQQNTRIIACLQTKTAIVVDPGGDVPRILNTLLKDKLICAQIWLTHSHLDHCGGVKKLKEITKAELYAHPEEKILRSNVGRIAEMYGLSISDLDDCPEPEHYIKGGELLHFGEDEFEVIFTPGHSPGHVVFYEKNQKILIGGDLLFAGSVGRTDLPGGDYNLLLQSLALIAHKLPGDTKILPGHGPDTTLGTEIKNNSFMREAIHKLKTA